MRKQRHVNEAITIAFTNSYKGLGIALVAAQRAQVPVKLIDTSDKALDKGLAFAGNEILRLVSSSLLPLSHG